MTILYALVCRSKDACVLVDRCIAMNSVRDEFIEEDEEAVEAGVSSSSLSTANNNIPEVTVSLMEQLRDSSGRDNIVPNGEIKTFVQKNNYYSNLGIPDVLKDFIDAACTACSPLDNNSSNNDTHYFHVLHKNNLYFSCLSDSAEQRYQKVNYAFLHKVHDLFVKEFTRRQITNSNEYGMKKSFRPQLQLTMHYYNTNMEKLSRDEHVAKLMAKIDDMKNVMGRNMSLLYDRGENLADLVDMSDDMRQDTQVFQKKVKQFNKKIRAKHTETWYLKAFVVLLASLVISYLILSGMCGWNMGKCRITTINAGGE